MADPDLTSPEAVEQLIVWLMDAHEMGDTSKNPQVWRTLAALTAALEVGRVGLNTAWADRDMHANRAERAENVLKHEQVTRLNVMAKRDAAEARAKGMEAESAKLQKGWSLAVDQCDKEYARAEAAEARVAQLEGALQGLLKEASITSKRGAVTGHHWTHLGMAILKARAALGTGTDNAKERGK